MYIPIKRFTEIADAFYLAQRDGCAPGPKKIDIAAEEPFLYKDGRSGIHDLLASLKDRGFQVCVTTNGSLLESFVPRIKGLVDRVRVSLHSVNPDDYRKITGKAVLPWVLKGILKAAEAGVSVTLNRLLLEDYLEDLPEYLDFAVRNGLRVKLLQRHFSSPDFSSFEAEDALMENVVTSYLQPMVAGEPYSLDTDPLSPRRVFPLQNGARVELRLPSHKVISRFSHCDTCATRPKCERSSCLLPTSVKFTPLNGKINFIP